MKHELPFHCGKFWIEKLWNGFKREESSRKMYAMNDFISMMINGMDLDLDVKIQLALCWHRGSKLERPIQTINIEKHVGPNSGMCYFSEMDNTYTQCLGNEKLHQDIIEHEEKKKNRGICELAL